MKVLSIIFLSNCYLLLNAMESPTEPIEPAPPSLSSQDSATLSALYMYDDKKRSSSLYQVDGVALATIEEGSANKEKSSSRIAHGFVTTADGKRLSVKLELANLDKESETSSLEIQINEADLRKQMAKDLLQITCGDGKHKELKFKQARSHIEALIKYHDKREKEPSHLTLTQQLESVRHVSLGQLTAKIAAKKSASDTAVATRAYTRRTPSPRELYLKKSPPNTGTEVAYAALKDLVIQGLAESGASERNQKIWSRIIGSLTTIGAPIIVGLITYYLKGSDSTSNAPTNTTMPG